MNTLATSITGDLQRKLCKNDAIYIDNSKFLKTIYDVG